MVWNAPNILTLARIFLIPVFVIIYLTGIPNWNITAAIIFIVAAVTDWFDGFLARRNNQVSNFGKLWDPVADKLLVLAALLVLMDWEKIGLVVVLIIVAREFVISGLRNSVATKGVVIPADMSGKIKTATQMVAIVLLLLNDWPFSLIGMQLDVGQLLIWISAALAVYSCVEYFWKNASLLSDKESRVK